LAGGTVRFPKGGKRHMKEANFNYNTINGLDKKTAERLQAEFEKHGCRNKTEFLVFLLRKALDDLDAERSITDPKSIENVMNVMKEIKEGLKKIEGSQAKKEIDDTAYRNLLIQAYWLIDLIVIQLDIDAKYVTDGNMDFLPSNIAKVQREAMSNYENSKCSG